MDGYTLADKMRQARRRARLTTTEQALYYELVAVCNSEGWEPVFKCSNNELCLSLGIDNKTLIRARNNLINAKLIYYKSAKSKKEVGSYSFDEKLISGNIPPQTTPQTTPKVTPQTPHLIKQETKTILNICGKEKIVSEFYFRIRNEMIADQLTLERLCMNEHLSVAEMVSYIDEFIYKRSSENNTEIQTINDAQTYFHRWLLCELDKERSKKKGGINETKQYTKPDYGQQM